MNTSRITRFCALVLSAILFCSLLGCGSPAEAPQNPVLPDEAEVMPPLEPQVEPDVPANRYDAAVSPRRGANAEQPLVLAAGQLSGCFSPFFSLSPYDSDVVSPTQLPLIAVAGDGTPVSGAEENCLAWDYSAEVIENGAASEYRFVLKNGISFSDGEPVTAEDVIFSLYVLCDPLYDGSSRISGLSIRGLQEYRTQTTTEDHSEYARRAKSIFSAGLAADGSPTAVSGISEREQSFFWSLITPAGVSFAQDIIDYACLNFASYLDVYLPGCTFRQLCTDEALRTAFSMCIWGFGSYDTETRLFTDYLGQSCSVSDDTLTAELFWDNIFGCYGYDFTDEGVNYESAGRSFEDIITELYIREKAGGKTKEPPAISGISSGSLVCEDGVEREYVSIILEGVDTSAIYSMAISVAPQHYYTAGYEGETGPGGVAFNDPDFMAALHQKDDAPLGAGPYVFDGFADGRVQYRANDNFCLGSPRIAELQYLVLEEGEELAALKSGEVHFAATSGSVSLLNSISLNDAGLEGLSYILTESDSYGYIGIQAEAIPELEIRQAIACAMNPQLTIDDYFGALASPLTTVMPSSLWASPEEGESVIAYDGTGARSRELFLAAGCFYDEQTHLMYYPEGHAKSGLQVRLTLTLPSASIEQHPAGSMFLEAKAVLESIGVEVLIDCVPDISTRLQTAYESGLMVWAAAWSGGNADADMFPAWCSNPALNQSSAADRTGLYYLYENGSEAQLNILTALNSLVTEARNTLDLDTRRGLYAQALPLAGELAVEIPTYQRRNLYVYNSELIDSASLPDEAVLGPCASPMCKLWQLELN